MQGNTFTSPRNIRFGAMAAPVLIVGALVLMHSVAEPQLSSAQIEAPQDPHAMLISSMGGLTEKQQAAMSFRTEIEQLGETDSPFPLIEAIQEYSDDPDIVPETRVESGPVLTVSAIMASRAGGIALINGKAHREGDQVGGGWSIQSIDAQAKLVVLQRGSGAPVSIGLNQRTPLPAR